MSRCRSELLVGTMESPGGCVVSLMFLDTSHSRTVIREDRQTVSCSRCASRDVQVDSHVQLIEDVYLSIDVKVRRLLVPDGLRSATAPACMGIVSSPKGEC